MTVTCKLLFIIIIQYKNTVAITCVCFTFKMIFTLSYRTFFTLFFVSNKKTKMLTLPNI